MMVSISRVSDHNGVSLLYIMLEIHHSGWEPSNVRETKARQSIGMAGMDCVSVFPSCLTRKPLLLHFLWHFLGCRALFCL